MSEWETDSLYAFLAPTDPFDMPEEQAKQREWPEQLERYIAETEDAEERLRLFMIRTVNFSVNFTGRAYRTACCLIVREK